MKKILLFAILAVGLFLYSCDVSDPNRPKLGVEFNQLVLSKYVALGNSLTSGFQSGGLAEDFQLHSFPYYIAQQINYPDFQQPLIASPGLGSTPGKTPLMFDPATGLIFSEDLPVSDPRLLLKNALLPRPYDNLGIPGADLNTMLRGTSANDTGNPFYDVVLRNPNFGNTTQVQQAILLNPTLITLWIGNNDVLGAALSGGDLNQITPVDKFQEDLGAILAELTSKTKAFIVMANIPYVTDIPFVNALDVIYHTSPALGIQVPVPVVFGADFQPVDFDPNQQGLFIPLLTEEQAPVHVLLPALSAYKESGLGVPDSAALVGMGLPPATASALVQGMIAAGLTPSGIPIPANLTLTNDELTAIREAVDNFNSVIATLTGGKIPVFDANAMLGVLNTSGLDGYTGKFVLMDPANTAFSLDGVHPNNGGYAIIANAFINIINAALDLNVPTLDTDQFKGQYLSAGKIEGLTWQAVNQVKHLFVKEKTAR